MTDLNNIPPVDVSSTQRAASASEQATAAPRAPQPPYDTAVRSSDEGIAVQRNAPSLPSPSHIDVDQADAGLSAISQNVTLDFYEIAQVLVKLNQEAEKASRDQTIADILSVADEMNEAADDIRSGAGLALAGGVISGAGQIVSGGISVAGGVQSFKIASEAAPATEESSASEDAQAKTTSETTEEVTQTKLTETEEETSTRDTGETAQENAEETVDDVTEDLTSRKAELDKIGLSNLKEQNATFIISQKANSISMKTQGYSQITMGISQTVDSGFKYGSEQLKAESKKDEARAETLRSTLERERQYADSLHKSAQDMKQTLKDMQQSQHQTTSQIMQSRV